MKNYSSLFCISVIIFPMHIYAWDSTILLCHSNTKEYYFTKIINIFLDLGIIIGITVIFCLILYGSHRIEQYQNANRFNHTVVYSSSRANEPSVSIIGSNNILEEKPPSYDECEENPPCYDDAIESEIKL